MRAKELHIVADNHNRKNEYIIKILDQCEKEAADGNYRTTIHIPKSTNVPWEIVEVFFKSNGYAFYKDIFRENVVLNIGWLNKK